MKKMTKVLALVLALAMCLALCACGKGESKRYDAGDKKTFIMGSTASASSIRRSADLGDDVQVRRL